MAIQIPKNIPDLIRNWGKVQELFALAQKLENLKIVTSDNKSFPILFSQDNCIVNLNEQAAPPPPIWVAPEPPEPEFTLEAETIAWRDGAIAGGGLFEADSVEIANNFVLALKATTYADRIIYFLPLLGANLAAARMPLIDRLSVGISSTAGLANVDFSQSSGLQGNGSSAILDTLVKPSQLSVNKLGGLGYIEGNMPATGGSPIGCYGDDAFSQQRFVLFLRISTPRQLFWWGRVNDNPGTGSDSVAAGNAHYYGQCSSSTLRKLYRDGAAIGSAGTVGNVGEHMADNTIRVLGADEGAAGLTYFGGLCKGAYMTDGELSDAEIADFTTLVDTYLLTPTGR